MLAAAVEAAGDRVQQWQVRLINVETVVLPNIWSEEGTQDPELQIAGGYGSWNQFVRVWYEAD